MLQTQVAAKEAAHAAALQAKEAELQAKEEQRSEMEGQLSALQEVEAAHLRTLRTSLKLEAEQFAARQRQLSQSGDSLAPPVDQAFPVGAGEEV